MIKTKRTLNKLALLEKKEPFTKSEKVKYSLQKRNFIRGIQLRDNVDKETAKKSSDKYFLMPNKERKEFRQSVAKALIDQSPLRGKKRQPRTGELKPIKIKEQQELPITEKKEKEFSRKYTRDEVLNNPNISKRVLNASIKYPNDTLYQWQHGHNAGKR
jgi:hypothetical protein